MRKAGGISIFLIEEDASAKEYILQALLEQLEKETFEAITVKEIVLKAGVSRSTFYLYFKDKYHLMECLRERVNSKLLSNYEPKNTMNTHTVTKVTLKICQHIFQYRHFYKFELNEPKYAQALSEQLAKRLNEVYQDNSYAIFAGYGTIGYLTYWVKDNFSFSPEEVADELVKIGLTDWSR